MKKVISLVMVILAVILAFVGCSNNNEQETTTESTYPWENENWNQTETPTNNFYDEQTSNQNFQEQNTVIDNNYNNNYNNGDNNYNNNYNGSDNNQSSPVVPDNSNQNSINPTQNNNSVSGNNNLSGSVNGIISDENISKLENSQAEVYFSDNPNNKGIIAISQRYGVPKENLVALIKVNAEFPTITVLEFSGARDGNGELIMTYDEFINIYEINETDGSIIKANKNGMNNDGVNFIEAKVYVALAKEYFIPELPNLKANKRYD